MRRVLLLSSAWPMAGAISLFLALAPLSACADGRDAPHARVTLLSSTLGFDPARGTRLGVHFQLDDGWHVYWKNPGESGTPPAVTWEADGLEFSDFEFPTPERLQVPGATIYGYVHDVTLLVDVAASSGSGASVQNSGARAVEIHATVDYVICADVCVRETAFPELTLPVIARGGGPSDTAEVLAASAARVPKPMPAGWRTSAINGEDSITLTLTTGRRESTAIFFPYDNGLIDDSADPVVTPQADGVTVALKKSAFFQQAPARLAGIVSLVPGRAFVISAPWRSQP